VLRAKGVCLRVKSVSCRTVFGIMGMHAACNIKFTHGIHAPAHTHVHTARQKMPFPASLLLRHAHQQRISALKRPVVDQVADIGI
jgi:hypothetical protein